MFRQLVNTCTTSLVCGIVSVVFALADAAILSGTHLPSFFPVAVSIALISAAILAPVVGILSELRFCIAGSQEVLVVILTTIVISVSSTLSMSGSTEEIQIATVIATILTSSCVFGIVCVLAGIFRLGRFIRYLPYPIIAGFLSGASILLIQYSIELAIGESVSLENLNDLFRADNLTKLLLALIVSLALLFLSQKISPGALISALVGTSLAGFYLLVYATGLPIDIWVNDNWTLMQNTQGSEFLVLRYLRQLDTY